MAKNTSKAPKPKKGYTKHQTIANTPSGGKVVDDNCALSKTGSVKAD